MVTPEKAEIAVMSSLALHNLLHTKYRESYTPTDSIDFENEVGEITKGILRKVVSTNAVGLQPAVTCRKSSTAEKVQNEFKLHFNGTGQIPFQGSIKKRKNLKDIYEGNIFQNPVKHLRWSFS